MPVLVMFFVLQNLSLLAKHYVLTEFVLKMHSLINDVMNLKFGLNLEGTVIRWLDHKYLRQENIEGVIY